MEVTQLHTAVAISENFGEDVIQTAIILSRVAKAMFLYALKGMLRVK